MLLSNSCVYGLRASLYLASDQEGDYISIKHLSKKLDISFHFLTKTLQLLTAEGYLESQKGPKGGVRLSKPGDQITLLEIIEAIDGDELFTECVLGLPGCGIDKPCPLHELWANRREDIKEMMQMTTLQQMAKKGKNKNLRITPAGEFVWR